MSTGIQVRPRIKYFFSIAETAERIGLSIRHVQRFAKEHGIEPHQFKKTGGGGGRGFTGRFTLPQVEELRKLRACE